MLYIKTLLTCSLLMFGLSLVSQSDIEQIFIDDLQVFTKTIEGETYFYSNDSSDQNDQSEGVSISRLNGNTLEELSFIDTLSDSLICISFIDFWYEDNGFHFLAYSRNVLLDKHYMSIGALDFSTQKIDVISSNSIEIYSDFTFFDHYLYGVSESRTWIITEDSSLNGNPINAIRLQYQDGLLQSKRFSINSYSNAFSLKDAYYDIEKRRYYVYIGETFFILDDNFDLLSSKKYAVRNNAILFNGPDALVIGHDQDSLVMLDRLSQSLNRYNKSIVIRKNVVKRDSIFFNTDYVNYNPEDDCYYLRKFFKENYNYLLFSRSSANGFNDDYGFNILQFSKQGELLCDFRIDLDRPATVFSFDFIDDDNIVGSGSYIDNFTNVDHFIFSLKLGDIKTSTGTITLSTLESMIIQNPVTEYLYLRSNKYVRSHIIDGQGRIVLNSSGETQIDISNLSSGAYVFRYLFHIGWKNERFIKL